MDRNATTVLGVAAGALAGYLVRGRPGASRRTPEAVPSAPPAAPARSEAELAALAAEKRRIEVVHRSGERLAAARDLSELASVALAELAAVAGAEHGALWAVDAEDRRQLVLEAVLGADGRERPAVQRPGSSPAGRAIAGQAPVLIEEPVAELHLPLVLGGRVLGLLSLERTAPPGFGADERDTLARLAEQAAVALSNAVSFRSALRAARVNRAVLDATPDPVGLLGPDGGLLVHNAAMAAVWHLPGFEAATGEQVDGEQRGTIVLGERTYSHFSGPVRDETGELMGRLVVLRDVTAERESERLKDEFFALVSHELRTPLTSIIGYLELVRDEAEQLTPDANRFLEVVDRNAKRLLRLVGDMLFVAQVEAGRLSLERGRLDLRQVVADSVEAARPAAERAAVQLRLEATAVAPIDGDRDRVGQLVDNLLSNALKFTPEYGEVVVSLAPDGDGGAVVGVRDDGVGIPQGEIEHLFERFFRSSTATTGAVQGAGLGLAICKTIVEAHAGEITVESVEGEGTAVRVRLPCTAEAAA